MSLKELRDLSADNLKGKLEDLKREQFNLRFQAANLQMQNPSQIRKVRRDIARVKTLIAENKKAASAAASA